MLTFVQNVMVTYSRGKNLFVGVDLLNLPAWIVDTVAQNAHDFRLTVSYCPSQSLCPHCGTASPHIRFGKREQFFLDLPIQAKSVGLLLQCQRLGSDESTPAMILLFEDNHPIAERRIRGTRRGQ